MRYIISRTSAWGEMPIEGCEQTVVHRIVTFEKPNDYIRHYCRDSKKKDGKWVAVQKETSDVWVKEIGDVESFVDKYGECVVFPVVCEEGYREIEIYDTERES